jgi:predicted acetylornithine/succinylornithine family transaminase
MGNSYYVDEEKKYLLNTNSRYPIAFTKGKGANIWDADNKKYLDFLSGLAVTNFGHAYPPVTKAIKNQSAKLMHTSNLFQIPNQIEAAKLLGEISFPGRSFFCNSGTEANEAAIKFSRLRGNSIRKGKNTIIALHDSFHGRTTGAIKLTGQTKYQEGFEPLIENVKYVERNNLASLEEQFDDNVCAIFLEGIQGESGVHVLTMDFVVKTEELCKKHNALLVFDEIQTGFGRTGKHFSFQHFGITPDVITLAKAIANGLPMGAMHVQEKHKDIFKPGHHSSTFGGNPFCTAVACVVLSTLKNGKIYKNISAMSSKLFKDIGFLAEEMPNHIKGIRGKGLMIAISVAGKAKEINDGLLADGIIANAIGNETLRILPPFIITEEDIDLFINTLKKVIINM